MATLLERRADDPGYEGLKTPGTWKHRQQNGGSHRLGHDHTQERLARGLGWFSIGLGLAQIGAPRAVARLIGVPGDEESRKTMFALGLREITSGIGILTRPNPAPWLWSRVGGDVMDLALLGRELNSSQVDRTRVSAATAAVLGVTILDLYTSQKFSRTNGAAVEARREHGARVREAVTVNCQVEDAYRFWRDFQNLPRFMSHVASVRVVDPNRLHWTAEGPAGLKFEWDVEIVEDRSNQLIAWRALPGGDVDGTGSVQFRPAPGQRGTEVIMDLAYQPPGGGLVARLAKLLDKALEVQMQRDLRSFKQIIEVGEVVHSDASIHRGPHPAQPTSRGPDARELQEERRVAP
jgi:uncharacterized membrane protein